RSGLPSPLKSATASDAGPVPAASDNAGGNVPSPLHGRIETLFSPDLATARSRRPSRLKSPLPTEQGLLFGPRYTDTGRWKLPSTLPRRTATLSSNSFATARSWIPSSLTSPVAIDAGP